MVKAKSEKPKKTKKTQKTKEVKSIMAVGRRKTAIARVRLYPKKGNLTVNGKPIEDYFPGQEAAASYLRPFQATTTLGQFSGNIKVSGSGKSGQLGAVVHGLARALLVFDETCKPQLKKHGLLTRDPRGKERKKPGLLGARKAKQSPKR
jgi:small subunit ribosomal protein S9